MPFYDTSQIACTTHTLEIRNLGTDFYFDYVQINTPDPVGPSDALVTLGRTASSTQVPTAGKASSASPAATSPGSSGASATTAVSASIPASGFNPVASSSAAHRSLSKNFGAIVGIAVGGAVALLMIGCGLFRVHRRRTAVRLGPIYGFNPLVSPTTSSAYSGSHDRRWQGSSLQTVELHTDATDSNPIPSAQRSDIRYRHDLDSHAHGLIETVAPPRMDQPTSDPGARSGTQHSVDGGVRIEGGPLLPGRTVEEADRGSIASTLPPPYQHHTS
ncbi:hypothetical protein GY45DRAFT_1138106 [Cubamyces sp. BRFM 1775]|nr:hypothetical protein GY45DRAFT_1138106 [Cubamyces sp. BRFM 1775]